MYKSYGKVSVMILLVLTLAAFASAQTPNGPLKDFELHPSDSFEQSFTGGDSVSFRANFTNPVQKDLPLVARLEVSGPNMTEEGKEFETSSKINSFGDSWKNTTLGCYNRKENGNIIYECLAESEKEILGGSENNVFLEAESNPAIAPADYEMEFSVLSMIGVPRTSESFGYEDLRNGITLGTGNDRIMINAEFDSEDMLPGELEASRLDPIGVESPQDEYVNGVDIEMGDDVGQEDYSADLRIYYNRGKVNNLDETSLHLYRYQPKTVSWTELDSIHNTRQNYLEAEIPHFSVYGVFGDYDNTGGGTSSIDISNSATDEEEVDNNFTEDDRETNNNTDEASPPSINPQDNETEEESEETGKEEPENQTEEVSGEETGLLTGEFAESPFNPAKFFESLMSFLSGLF